jgi:ribosomal protein S18 acetylase RimI-like enzyme
MSFEIVTYREMHLEGVRAIWRESFPDDAPRNWADVAIPEKLLVQPELLIVAMEDDLVIGSVMAGYDGHRGWLNSVAVKKSHRWRGVGKALVIEAENRLQVLGCAKINLQIRMSNASVAEFYRRLGYGVEQRMSMGKEIEPKS